MHSGIVFYDLLQVVLRSRLFDVVLSSCITTRMPSFAPTIPSLGFSEVQYVLGLDPVSPAGVCADKTCGQCCSHAFALSDFRSCFWQALIRRPAKTVAFVGVERLCAVVRVCA